MIGEMHCFRPQTTVFSYQMHGFYFMSAVAASEKINPFGSLGKNPFAVFRRKKIKVVADQRDRIGIGVPGSELIGAVAGPHQALRTIGLEDAFD